jgi:hypothetical protein
VGEKGIEFKIGVVGRGVLIDIARFRGKEYLDKGESFDHKVLFFSAPFFSEFVLLFIILIFFMQIGFTCCRGKTGRYY